MRRNLYSDNGARPILLERRELPVALFERVAKDVRAVIAMIGEIVSEEERAQREGDGER